ncbi:MAG: hypothetical protein A2W03_08740 [Candidatus Aminicenantes bacterium RBG_16_63_16]|nr:MAG: hypothetical protein A2W03_08740 [Candidatus Aminicenantes bacterium RBG_16_63_16]
MDEPGRVGRTTDPGSDARRQRGEFRPIIRKEVHDLRHVPVEGARMEGVGEMRRIAVAELMVPGEPVPEEVNGQEGAIIKGAFPGDVLAHRRPPGVEEVPLGVGVFPEQVAQRRRRAAAVIARRRRAVLEHILVYLVAFRQGLRGRGIVDALAEEGEPGEPGDIVHAVIPVHDSAGILVDDAGLVERFPDVSEQAAADFPAFFGRQVVPQPVERGEAPRPAQAVPGRLLVLRVGGVIISDARPQALLDIGEQPGRRLHPVDESLGENADAPIVDLDIAPGKRRRALDFEPVIARAGFRDPPHASVIIGAIPQGALPDEGPGLRREVQARMRRPDPARPSKVRCLRASRCRGAGQSQS